MKNVIANLAHETSEIASNLLMQLNGTTVNADDLREKFVYGVLRRQAILLRDIGEILENRSDDKITSSFILFRCLLDDFITMLYFETKSFEERTIIDHTAHAHYEWFKLINWSKKINYKFFGGLEPGLANEDYENNERSEFLQNGENNKFFKNKRKFEFKGFPSVTAMMDLLPQTDIGKANAHAFVLWRLLSSYVHFSLRTYELESHPEVREIEIKQLKEVLSYCYKTLLIIQQVFNATGKTLVFSDPENVWNKLMEN